MNRFLRTAFDRTGVTCLLVLLLSTAIYLPGLLSRAISYDEAITLLETAGNASADWRGAVMPADASGLSGWPTSPQPAGELKSKFYGNPSLGVIAQQLRAADVHPPFYYWALAYWQRAFGPSIEAARALSLLCSVAAVGLLYAFCAVGGVKYPAIPTLTFALASASIDQAQQARNYSMAVALVGATALAALLLWKHEPENRTQRIAAFAAVALLCTASFFTNYLAAIPAGVIVLWLAAVLKRGRATLLIIVAVIGAGAFLPWLPALSEQMGARPGQYAGFLGWTLELPYQLISYARNLLNPARKESFWGNVALVTGVAAACCLGAFALLRAKTNERPQFMALVWALMLAPVVGVLALDVLFDKHLVGERYILFGVPALTVLITYKLGAFRQPLKALAYAALATLWLSQLVCANWGYELTHGRRTGRYRSLAKVVAADKGGSAVLFSGVEFGDGIPAALVYELPESLPVVFLRADSDPLAIADVLDRYDRIWQVYAGGPSGPAERAVAARLLELGRTTSPAPDAVLYQRQ